MTQTPDVSTNMSRAQVAGSPIQRVKEFFIRNKDNDAANDAAIFEFLPAAIEVEQTPSSKAGRTIIWLIVLLFVLAILWASFGKIDIVAVAQGKVIPTEAVKQIQSLETARVKSIHVKEGQRVEKGQVLIELDEQLALSELEALRAELAGVTQNLQRLELLSSFLVSPNHVDQNNAGQNNADQNNNTVSMLIDGAEPSSLSDALLPSSQMAQLFQEKSEVLAQLASLENERMSLRAEQGMAQAEISKKQQVIPVLKERVDALDTLRQKSYGSKLQFLELKQELIEEQQDLVVQKARLNQLKQSEQSVATQQALYLADKRKQTLAELNGLEVQHASLSKQTEKTEQRLQHYTLKAPITGQVQQLAVSTVEGVVQSAQPLMQIVPADSALEVEVMILNKDIGFVQEGQQAAVKIDTFNFTKYGLIDAEIISISDDAISNKEQDENLGLVYTARVQLVEDALTIDGKRIRLSPGMSVTAEVKTGQRRLIEFFLSPLLRYKQESLSER